MLEMEHVPKKIIKKQARVLPLPAWVQFFPPRYPPRHIYAGDRGGPIFSLLFQKI